ncbi:phosphatase 2C-like domain-containing protein [Lentinula raphanica]|nr:phosphatase 2C-like domain-containing protein [Lentinula raphanica]
MQQFVRAALCRQLLPKKRRFSSSPSLATTRTLTAVGISTTLIFVTSLAVARSGIDYACSSKTSLSVILCDSGLDDEENLDGKGLGGSGKFKRPRWTDEECISEKVLSSGPIWFPANRTGIKRCDALIVSANPESEDSIAVYFPDSSDSPDDRRSYLALFDGHNGPAMSDILCDNLIEYVARALSELPSQYEDTSDISGFIDLHDSYSDNAPSNNITPSISTTHSSNPADDIITDTIKQAFKEFDDALIDPTEVLSSPNESKTNAVRSLRYAYSGSCALMSIYDLDTKVLRVALTGDSRAVLGRKIHTLNGSDNGMTVKYEVQILSHDQNAHNPHEVRRLENEHPGEEVVKNGRVMGWGMARAFGDAAYKWSIEVQEKLYEKYLGDRVRENMKTPPYLTAEPEITATKIQKGDFLIMASDGLWDCLTSEEAVGLVGLWLSTNSTVVYTDNPSKDFPKIQNKSISSRPQDSSGGERVYTRDQLPLKIPLPKDSAADGNDKTPYYPWWHAQKRFVNKDDSAAAHLTRNALGGADGDLTEALLSLGYPRARRYRDDVGVIVAFF